MRIINPGHLVMTLLRARILPVVLIASSLPAAQAAVTVTVTTASELDANASTQVEFAGLSREQVARALWEEGKIQNENDWLGSTPVTVWPDFAAVLRGASFTYSLTHLGGLIHTRDTDTVGVGQVSSGKVVAWLRSEVASKGSLLVNGHGPQRNMGWERSVLQRTAWRLARQDKTVSYKGLSGWNPAGPPRIISKGTAEWIACKGLSPDRVRGYLKGEHYELIDQSPEKAVFTRELHSDPNIILSPLLPDDVTWASREKVVLRTVKPQPPDKAGAGITLLGVAAEGSKTEKSSFLFSWTSRTDLAGLLRKRVFDGLLLPAAIKDEGIQFVDPTPWADEIELPAWKPTAPTKP